MRDEVRKHHAVADDHRVRIFERGDERLLRDRVDDDLVSWVLTLILLERRFGKELAAVSHCCQGVGRLDDFRNWLIRAA